jgi:hypothetical protein
MFIESKDVESLPRQWKIVLNTEEVTLVNSLLSICKDFPFEYQIIVPSVIYYVHIVDNGNIAYEIPITIKYYHFILMIVSMASDNLRHRSCHDLLCNLLNKQRSKTKYLVTPSIVAAFAGYASKITPAYKIVKLEI